MGDPRPPTALGLGNRVDAIDSPGPQTAGHPSHAPGGATTPPGDDSRPPGRAHLVAGWYSVQNYRIGGTVRGSWYSAVYRGPGRAPRRALRARTNEYPTSNT